MLMEFGQDPALKARKERIYRLKEMKKLFDVRCESELTLEQRAHLDEICLKNSQRQLKKIECDDPVIKG